jgi:sugar lactone lactonase YvrE
MVALHRGFARLDPATGTVSGLIAPAGHDPGTCRFNDGKCDPAGRFWAGTMALDERAGLGSLYRLDSNGQASRVLSGVSISNGIAWNPPGTKMYHIDTPTSVVAAYDYDAATGEIRNRTIAAEVPRSLGWPDGMTIDEEGMLWIALWDGHAVTRWDPANGRCIATHRLPASRITSCAFGGPGLRSLFITSARVGLDPAELARQPEAGSVFVLEPGVAGRPASAYA